MFDYSLILFYFYSFLKSFAVSYGRSHLDKVLIRKIWEVQPRGGAPSCPEVTSWVAFGWGSYHQWGEGPHWITWLSWDRSFTKCPKRWDVTAGLWDRCVPPALAPGPSLSGWTVAMLTRNAGKHDFPPPRPSACTTFPTFPFICCFLSLLSPVMSGLL